MDMNRKGNIMIGLLFAVATLLVLAALSPAFNETFNMMKQSDSFNCKNYDADGNGVVGNHYLDYNSSLATNTIGCTVGGFGAAMIILSVVVGVIAALVSDRKQEQNYYGG